MREDVVVQDGSRKPGGPAFKTGVVLVVAGIALVILFKVLGFLLQALIVLGVVLVLASFILPYLRGKS